MKVLIDTNVVLDVLLNRAPWVSESQAVWDANHRGSIHGHIVATSITNLFYIARRLVGQPIALRCVCECLAAFDVLPVDGAILSDAAALLGGDFEDNVTICCAATAGMDVIVTRDPRGFVHSSVPGLSPVELIARLPQANP